MKLKDLKGFPKQRNGYRDGFNDAISEIGEIEVEIDEKVALEIIRPVMSYQEMEELAYALKTAKDIIKAKK